MTVSNTPNLGLPQWSADSDPVVTRAQLTGAFATLDDLPTVADNDAAYAQVFGVASPTGVAATDNAAVQAALNSAAPGSIVQLQVGTYLLNGINVPSNVWLRGMGPATVLKAAPSRTAPLVQGPSGQNYSEKITLTDFIVDGNKANQTSTDAGGIKIDNSGTLGDHSGTSIHGYSDPHHYINNVDVHDCKGSGLYMSGRGESKVNTMHIRRCRIGVEAYGLRDVWFTNIDVGESDLQGFQCDTKNSRYIACKSWGNGKSLTTAGTGFTIVNWRNVFIGCEAQENYSHGFGVFGGAASEDGSTIQMIDLVGCLADANCYNGSVNPTASFGFWFKNAINCRVSGMATDYRGALYATPTQIRGVFIDTGCSAIDVDVFAKNQVTSGFGGTQDGNTIRMRGQEHIERVEGATTIDGKVTVTAGDVVIDNNVAIKSKSTGGTESDLAKINTSNHVVLGSTARNTVINAVGLGFYGGTPTTKPANPGVASGADATVINNIIQALRNLGLVT